MKKRTKIIVGIIGLILLIAIILLFPLLYNISYLSVLNSLYVSNYKI